MVTPFEPSCRASVKQIRRPALCGLIAVACLFSTAANGVEVSATTQKAIDAAVAAFMKKRGIPGCSVSLGLRGALVHAKGYGRAGPQSPAAADTVYRIGSLTKQFTAGLALQAAASQHAGRFSLDAPLETYFPDQKQWTGITVRQLLNHTSGIPTYTARAPFRRGQFEPVSHQALLDQVKAYTQVFKAGTRGHYSNSNYLLLAHILQDSTGQSYRDLLQHNVFDPLGMNDTAVISPKAAAARTAQGSVKGRFVSKRTHPNWALGVGDLQSSVLDIAKWNMALLGNSLLPETARKLMFASGAANPEPGIRGERFAMGWMQISRGGADQFYHQGYLHGFSAVNYLADPFGGGNRFVTILCNAHLVQNMPELAIRIARIL